MRRVRSQSAKSQQSAVSRSVQGSLPVDDGTITTPGAIAMIQALIPLGSRAVAGRTAGRGVGAGRSTLCARRSAARGRPVGHAVRLDLSRGSEAPHRRAPRPRSSGAPRSAVDDLRPVPSAARARRRVVSPGLGRPLVSRVRGGRRGRAGSVWAHALECVAALSSSERRGTAPARGASAR